MAHNRGDHGLNSSSPHSSIGGAESLKGTPDTRLTAFSPDEGSGKKPGIFQSLRAASAEIQPVQFPMRQLAGAGTQGVDDPFVTSTRSVDGRRQKLSPTATIFKPVASTLIARGSFDESSPTRNSQWITSPGYGNSQSSLRISVLPACEPIKPSHCLAISARSEGGHVLSTTEIEQYITVSHPSILDIASSLLLTSR